MQISRLCSVFLLQALVACSADTVPAAPSSAAPASTAQRSPTVAGSSASATPGTGSVGVGTPANTPAAASCPSLRPVEDTVCTTSTMVCTYDEIECGCPSGKWACAEPVDPNCPPMMPMHASPCSVPEGTECEFLQDECACMSGKWSCEAFELDDAGVPEPPTMPIDAGASTTTPPPASTDTCPDLRPIEGFSCEVANRTCRYDTTSCVCPMGSWLCAESVDPACPIEPPTPGNACMGAADCDYFNIECECRLSAWTCKEND
ncbi:MAG TPA: hypothetical protein VMF89_06845 [Polyangiales bacterium]|nr:hypothetical protein [Polyangiales bacterium]